MHKTFISSVVPPDGQKEPAWWFAFRGSNLLVRREESSAGIPCLVDCSELGVSVVHQQYLGFLDGRPCYSVELAEDAKPPEGMTFQGLRQLFGLLDEDLFWVAGRAVQIVDWDRTHQFCGRCGSRTVTRPMERAKECPRSGQTPIHNS